MIYHKTEYREQAQTTLPTLTCSDPVLGFDTQREAFLGPYRGWDRPLVVQQGESTNSIAHGWAPIGSHFIQLTLGPGETHDTIFVLG